jgi:hypothetical protein
MADTACPRGRASGVDGSAARMKVRSMPTRNVCYFTVVQRGAEVIGVRFGFSCRMNSQIETTDANWQKLSRRLREQGFRLIECPDGASGAPGMTGQASLRKRAGFSVRSTRRCR